MKNGDRLTCEIKGLTSGSLYVSLDYVDGTISVDWSKVAHLESRQAFIIEDENGSVFTGAIVMDGAAGRPARIRVVGNAGKDEEIDATRVVKLGETSESFWQRFSGETNLGIIFSKGNESTQLNFSSLTEYLRERWSAQANYTSSLSASSGVTSTRNQVTLGSMRLLRRDNYFYAGLASFSQISEEKIALQSVLGAGIGRYLQNTNHAKISLLGGLAWVNTEYSQTTASTRRQNLAAALIASDLRLFRFNKTNLRVTTTVLPAISAPDRGRVRIDTNAFYYIKLLRKLSWNFSFYGSWDNQPPTGISGNDYGASSGLTWTYGYK